MNGSHGLFRTWGIKSVTTGRLPYEATECSSGGFSSAGGAEEGTRGCGYALNRRFWGQGYMTEAARAIFAYEFTVLGTRRIFAECETPNTASERVMQKSGMIYEGTFYNADFEGNWAMRHRYAISKQDWEVVSGAKK